MTTTKTTTLSFRRATLKNAPTNLDLVAVLFRHSIRRLIDVLHALQESLARDVQHAVDVWSNREALLDTGGYRFRGRGGGWEAGGEGGGGHA